MKRRHGVDTSTPLLLEVAPEIDINPGADPENELGGGQFWGSPVGSRGGGPVGGLGDEVPQKLTTFRS